MIDAQNYVDKFSAWRPCALVDIMCAVLLPLCYTVVVHTHMHTPIHTPTPMHTYTHDFHLQIN